MGKSKWVQVRHLVLLAALLSGRALAGEGATAPQVDLEFAQLNELLGQRKPQNPKYQADFQMLLSQAANRESLVFPEDRDPVDVVIRRTGAMLKHLMSRADAPDLSARQKDWERLRDENARVSVSDVAGRRNLFASVVRLRRQIALANPLLRGLDRILFIKRDRAGGIQHMCDQFYGFNAHRSGGLFVLENPFSDHPTARNLLENSLCADGRFQGRKLEHGGFLSPDVSFDGRRILFAFTEANGRRYEWTPQSTFHVFAVNADGSNLRQLTDGSWNDFDPCWMPNGRIVFISERRGGYLRCSGERPCPNYTLHSMNDDGSDIVCLSPHELHEWQPSIDNQGMVIFTRWDYIDRGANQAHHPWITTPDGRDPRAIQGNYAQEWRDRPHMEMDLRAIPGSRKLVAVAVAHHGPAFGSLITVDPGIPDDDKMAQVRRITPEARFPECEVDCASHYYYATPWPLDENFYLCIYSPTADKGKYGIYLVDVFGNKELIYQDPAISCYSPMPLSPRPRPPIVPQISTIGIPKVAGAAPPTSQPSAPARMAVMNVYASRYPMPEGVKIKALRILHVVLKSTPVHHAPQIGYGCETPARAILGTVPVEEDGSAFFLVPPAKSVFFQALDENGLAVQTMRSETWAQPGEMLTCNGCHDIRSQAPALRNTVPLALQRPPSEIRPEVDGSHPFSFPRLVQPVLERNCVSCHLTDSTKKAPDLRKGDFMKDRFRWYTSYRNLAPYAFHYGQPTQQGYDIWTTPRSIPGKVGAHASKLYALLQAGHHGVRLSPEEMHRLTLWLDCNSDFFGCYNNIKAQSRGEVVYPSLE